MLPRIDLKICPSGNGSGYSTVTMLCFFSCNKTAITRLCEGLSHDMLFLSTKMVTENYNISTWDSYVIGKEHFNYCFL